MSGLFSVFENGGAPFILSILAEPKDPRLRGAPLPQSEPQYASDGTLA